jgi:hypothetical protein
LQQQGGKRNPGVVVGVKSNLVKLERHGKQGSEGKAAPNQQ